MIISLIAALDRNQLIGSNNEMPWHLPEDFKFFKSITMGKPILMGRKTFESIGRPLPGRQNIVISRHGFMATGVSSADSIEFALSLVQGVDEVMIIGGGHFFQQMIDKADQMYLTHVDAECEGDVWFPKFDIKAWDCSVVKEFAADGKNNFNFKIIKYVRK